MIPRILPVIAGRGGAWPFAGCWYGLVDDGDPEGSWVAWAGRVGATPEGPDGLETAWRASRALHRAMLKGGLPAPPTHGRDPASDAGIPRLTPAAPPTHGRDPASDAGIPRRTPPAPHARKALSGVLGRLDPALPLPGMGTLGAIEADELALLVIAGDREGIAVTGTGLGGILGIGHGEPLVEGAHPLLTMRGAPGPRTGALSIPWADLGRLPRWLVAVPAGEDAGSNPETLRRVAGIDPPGSPA